MPTIVLVAIALAGMSLTSTFADTVTWCATYRLGSTNCGYSSSEECLATVRGLGGFWQPNPFPGRPTGPPPGAGIPSTRQGVAIGAPISADGLSGAKPIPAFAAAARMCTCKACQSKPDHDLRPEG
jgi:hypothetical protein